MPAPSLKTKRLILRNWKKSDLEPFFHLNSDPKVMEFFPSTLSRKQSNELAEKFQVELDQKNYGFWAVEIAKQNKFIGCIGLHNPNFKAHFTPCTEIGWRLALDSWGQGYATEGATEALKYGFEKIKLKEIVTFTSKINKRSISLMKRLNMKHNPKDDFEHPSLSKEDPLKDHVLYRMKRTDWLKGQKTDELL